MQHAVAFTVDLDVIEFRCLRDDEVERVIDLMVDAGRPFMAFDQGGLCALPDID